MAVLETREQLLHVALDLQLEEKVREQLTAKKKKVFKLPKFQLLWRQNHTFVFFLVGVISYFYYYILSEDDFWYALEITEK